MDPKPNRFLKAYAVSLLVVGGGLIIGFVIGAWLIPMAVMLLGNHELSLCDFPLKVGVLPGTPEVINPKKDRNQFLFLEYGIVFVGLACSGVVARFALQLNHYLIVRKFRWLSHEEAMRM